MTPPRDVIVVLTRRFLAGSWSAEELLRRGRLVVGNKRWLEKLVARVMGAFHDRRPQGRELRLFLRGDERLARILNRRPLMIRPQRLSAAPAANLGDLSLPMPGTVRELAEWLQLSLADLGWFADLKTLSRLPTDERLQNYHARWLAKQGGTWRLIESPKTRLKAVQRQILREIIDRVPPHAAAHGFRRGRSIATFAAPHVGQRLVLRMDLADFFPVITRTRVRGLFFSLGYSPSVARYLAGLCTAVTSASTFATHPGRERPEVRFAAESLYGPPHLPQGAPTSPAVANLCAYRLDTRLTGLARSAAASYTRYADDLAFSGAMNFARGAKRFAVSAAAVALEEGFRVNFRKTRRLPQSVRQRIAGVVVNERVNVPREAYKSLRAILHNCVRFGPAEQNRAQVPDFASHLAGRIAYIAMLNPEKGRRLAELWRRIAWP